jgi:phage terminase large subunit
MGVIERRVVIPYTPREVFRAFHDRHERFAVIVAHRRCGKTVASINDMIRRAALCPLDHGRYAFVAPFRAQGKEIAWEYLKRYARPILSREPNESELWIEVMSGARITIHGADNPDRLRGSYLDGVVLDEYADMWPSVWGEIIRPMLADRQGWAVFIGTPRGRNSFWQAYDSAGRNGWFSANLRASETGLLSAEELEDARRDMTPEQYEQEFECSFDAAIVGSYYGKTIAEAERQGRIRELPHDAALPVHCAWDLGIGDSTSIWFAQFIGPEIRVIDFYENSGFALDHYAKVLADRGYRYGHDFVPHDAKVRELGTGRTRIETLGGLGRKPALVPDHKIEDGINAVRLILPRCYFDRSKCAVGLEALRQYRSDYDEKKRAFSDKPRHDWTSHAADAFRYLSMAWREIVAVKAEPLKPIFTPMPEMMWWEIEEIEARANYGRLERL